MSEGRYGVVAEKPLGRDYDYPQRPIPTYIEPCIAYDSPVWVKTDTIAGDNIVLSTDTSEFPGAGGASVKIAVPAMAASELWLAYCPISPTVDIRQHTIVLRYYTDHAYEGYGGTDYPDQWTIYLGSNGNMNDYFGRVSLPISPGWHNVEIPISQLLQTVANPPDLSAINVVGFYYKANTSTGHDAFDIHMDYIAFYHTGTTKARFIFTFDDAYANQLTYGAKYLAKYGFSSHIYAEPNTWGTGSRMSVAQLHTCEEYGALISSHYSGTYFDFGDKSVNYPDRAVVKWCETIKRGMEKEGFVEGADYIALPGGTAYLQSEDDVRIMRKYFRHIRGTGHWREMGIACEAVSEGALSTYPQGYVRTAGTAAQQSVPFRVIEPWWGSSSQVSGGAAFEANMEAFIDNLVTYKDLGCFFYHNIEAGAAVGATPGGGYDITQGALEALADYVQTKVAAGTLEVITFKDLLRG